MYGGCLRESHRVVCVFFNPMENEVTLEEFIFHTLESGIDVGQGITIGPGKFVKKNKCRALNKRRA